MVLAALVIRFEIVRLPHALRQPNEQRRLPAAPTQTALKPR